jgi:hypothetical protein
VLSNRYEYLVPSMKYHVHVHVHDHANANAKAIPGRTVLMSDTIITYLGW